MLRRSLAFAIAVALLCAPAASARVLTHRAWLSNFVVTEYYPTSELTCCNGALAPMPGVPGARAPVDFLYGPAGLSMEGEAFGRDGQMYHIAALGQGGWVNALGRPTRPTAHATWTAGPPAWRNGAYWLTADHHLTYPLATGGWAKGPGVRYVPPPAGISFAPGPSRPLTFWRSVAVDPRLIPLGSRVFIPAYVGVGGSNGWFVAQDTGGAILGRHVDVYRTPPHGSADAAHATRGLRVYIIPPGA